MTTALELPDVSSSYPLTRDHVDSFRKHGFVKLKNLLTADALDYFGEQITRKVFDLNTEHLPLEQRDTYRRAFLQVTNIWRTDETVKAFAFSERLAKVAAELLGVDGVRMYHDQALYKEASGGFTPWHADQVYWPLAGDKTVTAWIPLQATPVEMGPIAFASGSHRMMEHRDLRISDESETAIRNAVESRQYPYVEEPFELGEVSFHYGWTYHRAGANTTGLPRKVMTVIYMDRDMRIENSREKQTDWAAFCDEIPDGQVCAGSLNPILWER